ncbi:VOC family protein [Lujinxingia sediminis]|uniref:VOC family protein n=1 Tax=Lujinxingia sediminis TaxID=2480984 RepID=A0ABY0CSP1_9DELT|nr:VOC family protein [Lujinxingia sediminis]RVU43520.1 VOC family protein [Lujinxingia sediminis]
MNIVPYLTFDGTCKEAFGFYRDIFGGTLTVQTVGESEVADEMPAEYSDRVMHACLQVGDRLLMASDALHGGYETPRGVSISLQMETPEEAERVFAALADGGQVTMPLEKTFWALRFGMVTDRFGTPWMINCNERECID